MKGLGIGGARPAPKPQPAGQPIAAPARTGGLFPHMDAQTRYDMAMDLLRSGMQSAAASNDPLLAFLSPIAGAAIGGGIENRRGKAREAETAAMNDQLLGTMAGDPAVQGYIDILNNPNAPDYAKSIAKTKLDAIINPKKVGGGTGGRVRSADRAPTNTDALLASMFHRSMSPDSEGGETITPAEQARIDSVRTARARSSSASITYGSQPQSTATPGSVVIDGYTIEQVD